MRQHYKSEHWAPCQNHTSSWYDLKIVESNVIPEQTNKQTKKTSRKTWNFKMSRDMTKPTKWLWAQQRRRSAWAHSPPSLIRVFGVRMNKAWVLSYTLSTQRRLWSDCADAQADLSLRWAHTHFVGFVMLQLKSQNVDTQADGQQSQSRLLSIVTEITESIMGQKWVGWNTCIVKSLCICHSFD